MKAVIQRVTEASVEIDGVARGVIGKGLLVLVGIARSDTLHDADYLVDKTLALRLFPDESGRMNRNVAEAGGALLLVSQFTLCADCRRGRRPSFDPAAPPDLALELYNYFVEKARAGRVPVETGSFQATMQVRLTNDGPVTILLDSSERRLS
jgi:D-aminoacyl-tRNA deacylase